MATGERALTRLIFGHDDELAAWAEAHYPACAPLKRPLTAIGIASSYGEALGVAIFHNFRQHDIDVTFVAATPRWATPGNVRAILHYPFVQLGVKRMTATTSKNNHRARKLLIGLGFRLEGTHPFAHDGIHAVCSYGLYRNVAETKWLARCNKKMAA